MTQDDFDRTWIPPCPVCESNFTVHPHLDEDGDIQHYECEACDFIWDPYQGKPKCPRCNHRSDVHDDPTNAYWNALIDMRIHKRRFRYYLCDNCDGFRFREDDV